MLWMVQLDTLLVVTGFQGVDATIQIIISILITYYYKVYLLEKKWKIGSLLRLVRLIKTVLKK